jgi:hypothetical protein
LTGQRGTQAAHFQLVGHDVGHGQPHLLTDAVAGLGIAGGILAGLAPGIAPEHADQRFGQIGWGRGHAGLGAPWLSSICCLYVAVIPGYFATLIA